MGFSNTLTTGSTPVLAQPSKVKQGGRLDFICPIVFSKLWGRVHICGNFHSSLTLCSGLAGYGDEVLACPGGGQGEQEEEGEDHLVEDKYIFITRQIYCVIWREKITIWTNTFRSLNKYTFSIWTNIFCNLEKYIALRLIGLVVVFLVNPNPRIRLSVRVSVCHEKTPTANTLSTANTLFNS